VHKGGQPVPLTPREYELLVALASNPGRTFTRAELIQSAFGHDYDAFDRTVDSHIKNLRGKIEDEPARPRYVCTVHGVGYRLGP
jgi:two-component system OmpR family response regulator